MLELENLTYSYRHSASPAVADITMSLLPGIYLLVGENGAGKTTMLHLLAGLRAPQGGDCRYDGESVLSPKIAQMGRRFILEENMYFPGTTIRNFARVHSRFYPKFSDTNFTENLEAFGLTGHEPLRRLSLGNRKKAQLAYVLALGVDYLLLDEPTNALDIMSKQTLQQLMAKNISQDQTVIISTHTIFELENLYDGIIAISRGRLLLAATADEVGEALAFVTGKMPHPMALHVEHHLGHYLSVVPADESDTDTMIDWRMLYAALLSCDKDKIVTTIKNTNHE